MTADAFSAMAATLTAAAPEQAEVRYSKEDEDRGALLGEHWQQHNCLPFPAGPVVPHPDPARLPTLGLRLTVPERATATLQALRALSRPASPVQATASSLTAQFQWAAVEWCARHATMLPDMSPSADSTSRMKAARAVLLGLDEVAEPDKHRNGHLDEVMQTWLIRLDAFRDNDNSAAQRTVTRALKDGVAAAARMAAWQAQREHITPCAMAYSGLHYRCSCGETDAAAVQVSVQATGRLQLTTAQRRAMKAQLAEPLGEWPLLAGLWLKLVKGHLGMVFNASGRLPAAHRVLHHAARRVLDDMALDARYKLAPLAAGVARALNSLQPYRKAAGSTLPTDLPECFSPATLDDERAVLAEARVAADDVAREDHPALVDWVDDTAHLARDVASLLTDALLASTVGWQTTDHTSLAGHIEERKKPGKGEASLAAAVPDATYRSLLLLPRMERMFRYHGWMARHGAQAMSDALGRVKPDALVPSLIDRPPAVHGGLGVQKP